MSDAERWDAKWKMAQGPGEPSAFFESALPGLLARLRKTPGARALDVAAGLGRHALPLARAGIQVDAAEISGVAAGRLSQAAGREALPIRLLRCDLSNLAQSREALGINRYGLILDFFYLERPLFPVLARAARPGATLLVETRLSPGEPGSPGNPKGYWLAPGELARLLRRDWRLLELHEEGRADRALARAIARRR